MPSYGGHGTDERLNEALVKDASESSPPETLTHLALSGGLWTTLNTLITKSLGGVKVASQPIDQTDQDRSEGGSG